MFTVDRLSRTPIYEQIVEQFKEFVLTDRLDFETPLPSIRNLSQALSVNPNTLQKAYTLLENEGLCYSVPGSGRYVSKDAKAIISKDQRRQLERIAEEVTKLAYKGMTLEEILEIVRRSFLKTAEKNGE